MTTTEASCDRRHQEFRRAADALTEAWSSVEMDQRIALIGSVARPLWKELPRFGRYRRAGIDLWHACKDLDLAIWLLSLGDLSRFNRLRGQTLNLLYRTEGIGVAHHQADVFVLAAGSDRYLGRLCTYGTCPKGKVACRAPDCGDHRFLQQIEGFVIQPATLSPDRSVILFDRSETIQRKAVDLERGSTRRHVLQRPPAIKGRASLVGQIDQLIAGNLWADVVDEHSQWSAG